MRTTLLSILVMGSVVLPGLAADQPAPKTQKEQVSYSFGMNLGNAWKNQGIEVDLDLLMRGIKDAQDGKKPLLSELEMREVVNVFQQELRAKQEVKRTEAGAKNKVEGEAFLAANKTKPGIVTTASGLQYKVVTQGKGEVPKATDSVNVNFIGTLLDGTEFDNSYKRGQPLTLKLDQGIIKGWSEGIQLMKVGSKYQFYVPPQLAYGENGLGMRIMPNAVLVFEMELMGIGAAPTPTIVPVTSNIGGSTTSGPTAQAPKAINATVTSDIIKVPSAEEMKKGAQIEVIKKEDLEKQK
jgi:FKBP-type peptidyl-prolyl cis-trans isomerase